MKILKLIGLFSLIMSNIYSQNPDNIGFELGDFSYWQGYRGYCCGGSITKSGIENGWHTLMQVQGYDTNTNNTVSYIAPEGGNYSVRLGNPNAGGEAERLTTSFLITQDNVILTYMYAVVFQESAEHSYNEKPKLQIRILNSAGNPINLPCAVHTIIAMPNTPGWDSISNIYYKNWTEVSVDLSSFIGQMLTLEFTTQDCGQEGHFGYAYIDAIFNSAIIRSSGCNQSNSITLYSPIGFAKYYWYPGRETTQNITVRNPVEGDTFRVELTNECGSVTVLEKIIKNVSYPEVTANNDTTICLGSPLTLTAFGKGNGIKYYWHGLPPNQPTLSRITVYPAFSTMYTVYVEDSNGCVGPKSTATVKVTVDNHLFFVLRKDTIVCPGTILKFESPIKGKKFLWTVGSNTNYSTDSAISYKFYVSTNISLNLSDSLCSYTNTIHIEVPSPFKQVVFCEHDTIAKLSAPMANSYYWVQTGDTSQKITIYHPKDGAKYTLIMSGAGGCFDTLFYNLFKSYDPMANCYASKWNVCYGQSVRLSGGGGTSCYWYSDPPGFNSSDFDFEFTPDKTRTYYFKTRNYYGCEADTIPSVLIKVNKDAYFRFNPVKTIGCFGDTITVKANTNKGSFYWWSRPPGFNSSDSFIKVIPVKPITYILTHQLNGCSYGDEITLSIYPRPDVKLLDYCVNDSLFEIVPKIKYSSYLWLPMHDTAHSITIKLPPTLKKVWLSYTLKGGCSDTQEYIFNKIPNPKIQSLPDTIICMNTEVILYARGCRSYYHYQWLTEKDSVFSISKNPVVSPKIKTKYKVIVTNEIGCYGPESTDSFTISMDTNIKSELANDTFICKGKQLSLKPTKGIGSCYWSSDPPGFYSNNSTVVVTPKITTRYYLQIINGKCVGNKSDILVNIRNLPLVNAGNDKKICIDSIITLSVLDYPTYKFMWWSNQSSFISSQPEITVHPLSETIYYITVTDSNGCRNTDTIKVTPQPKPVINFNSLIRICENMVYRLNAYNFNCSYQWSTGDTTSFIMVKYPGTYRVIVNNNGCTQEGQAQVEWIQKKDTLIIPNIFTPNNDGTNDIYKVKTNHFEYFNFLIYNRWGQEIFASNDPEYSWNGMIDGKFASPGVYFYLLEIKPNCEEAKSYTGTITLVR